MVLEISAFTEISAPILLSSGHNSLLELLERNSLSMCN